MKLYWFLIPLFCSFSAHSDCKNILNQLTSTSTQTEESQLRKQGFPKNYTAGVDKANEIIQVKKKLEKINANPYTTHVPYFASQVNDHIEEIEKAILNQKEAIPIRLKLFEELKKDAQNRIQNKTVTYDWWIPFNVKLVTLAETPASLVEELIHELNRKESNNLKYTDDFEKLYTEELSNIFKRNGFHFRFQVMMDRFPEEIMFPVTGELGIMAFNKVINTGSHFLGLSGYPVITDNREHSPREFLFHDITHNESIRSRISSVTAAIFKKKSKNLTFQDRKKFEIIYFIITHELVLLHHYFPKQIHIYYDQRSKILNLQTDILETSSRFRFLKDLGQFLPDNVSNESPEEIETFLKEGAEILFRELSSE